MDDKKKKLSRMAVWTIAIFATVFAVFMAAFWMLTYPVMGGSAANVLLAALGSGWPIFLIVAVLCLGTYFGYRMYLNKKK